MNSDSIFRIGSTHHICQDYACHGSKELGQFSIIADGCSGSPNTDFGSRILCSLTRESILRFFVDKAREEDVFNSYRQFRSLHDIVHQGNCILHNLSLPIEGLDSTLLYIVANKDWVEFEIKGDGYIVFKEKDGDLIVYNLEYPQGYPYYLSYMSGDRERTKSWNEIKDNKPIKTFTRVKPDGTIININPVEDLKNPEPTNEDSAFLASFYGGPYIHTAKKMKEKFEFIAVLSDGVGSFYKSIITDTSKTTEPIAAEEILPEMLSFKNFSGQFVKRRFKKFSKKMESQNIFHYDDISLGVVYLGGE